MAVRYNTTTKQGPGQIKAKGSVQKGCNLISQKGTLIVCDTLLGRMSIENNLLQLVKINIKYQQLAGNWIRGRPGAVVGTVTKCKCNGCGFLSQLV